MKKFFINIISLLLVFCLVACGEYSGPINSGGNNGNQTPPANDNDTPGDNTQGGADGEERIFTVSLTYNGEPFSPTKKDNVMAQWSDGYTYKRAEFDENGKASVTGLDGDYNVTLTALPSGYTYNPNIYTATNDRTDVTIELYQITKTRNSGADYYSNVIEITKTAVYRATLEREGQIIYFQFAPKRSGTYSIESLVDMTADNVNPILHIHEGSSAYKNPTPIVVDGGSGAYTSNFRYEIEVDSSMISANGGVVYAFGIKVELTDGTYPVNVDFSLQYDGGFALDFSNPTLVVPEELDKIKPSEHEYDSSYTFVGAETSISGKLVFEDSMYKLNPETGFYHLYDIITDTYGPILYAYITSPSRFVDTPLTSIEAAGNKALTVNEYENYKLFIEGYYPLTIDPGANNPQATTGPYLCVRNCPCRKTGSCDGGCPTTCNNCHEDCRKVPAGGIGCIGYAGVANSDGLVPVTEELKQFLQKFAISQRYFMDGNGWAELRLSIYAGEDDQWLFNCGYYVKK